jgi:hypothetical protein
LLELQDNSNVKRPGPLMYSRIKGHAGRHSLQLYTSGDVNGAQGKAIYRGTGSCRYRYDIDLPDPDAYAC